MKGNFWVEWGWVVGCVGLTSLLYFQGIAAKKKAISEFLLRTGELEEQKEMVLLEQEELKLKMASQSDPAWIEMVLIRDLGVVPEGWLKVHFKNPTSQ